MRNAKPLTSGHTTPTTTPSPFEFTLEVGQESVILPHGWMNPDAVWLLDIRRRRIYLERATVEEFTVLGRRYQTSAGEAPVHLRGLPRYYCMREGVMWLWPVPAHAWSGAMEKSK